MTRRLQSSVIVLISLLVLSACGSGSGPSLAELPHYPGAVAGEAMEQSMMGMMGGKLEQYSTTDSFDEVLAFYQQHLVHQSPEYANYTTEFGRQTAISLPQEGGVVTVAIQEFPKEDQVVITFMAVGR